MRTWILLGWFATLAVGCNEASKCGGPKLACSEQLPSGTELARSALARSTAPSTDNVAALGAGNRAFAFDLYQQAAKQPGNVVLSPYSVSTALGMTYAGARTTTEREIEQTLHFTLEQAPLHEAFNAVDLALSSRGEGKAGADGTPFRLHVNNSIWAQRGYPIEAAYLDTLAVNYGAGVYLTDFARDAEGSRTAINEWVEQRTEELIPELLAPGIITSQTVVVLTNTVYFNAAWKTKFTEGQTRELPFRKLDGSSAAVDMMHARLSVPYAEGVDYRAVALPYANDALVMIAVLPDEGKFAAVERAFDAREFDALEARWQTTSASVGFPKLDYKTPLSLKKALMALGMVAPFTDADFSGMTSRSPAIEEVIHEAVIKVFEGGTIAAAATAVILGESADAQSISFDRPFLYYVYDRPTGTILFVGRVLDPSAS
jgi:serpin B